MSFTVGGTNIKQKKKQNKTNVWLFKIQLDTSSDTNF